MEVIELSEEHHQAVNRRRRIVIQYDASGYIGADWQQWTACHFDYFDEPGHQVDSIWWDIGGGQCATYPSKVLEPFDDPNLQKWWDQGIDWVEELVAETHKCNLEVFWNDRVNEVDVQSAAGGLMAGPHPLKNAHSDWLIKTWYEHGLWNYAVPELRQFRLEILRELAENYDFDGIQLDFARHVPCLPLGEQWEHRDDMTEFVRMVRVMLLEIEHRRGRPFLLAAKVPRNLEGCRIDGFDVETWAQQNLVDILTLGSRSMDVDIAAFRRVTAGRNTKLQPCFDGYHATDGYQTPPTEHYRGVFSNWWQQGADSVVCFNWGAYTSAEALAKLKPGAPAPVLPLPMMEALHEAGSPETLRGKNKFFAVERRGGFPWAEGFFNRNDTAPLPMTLANDGMPVSLTVRTGDNLRADADKLKQVILRTVLFGAGEQDEIEAQLNGVPLPLATRDPLWKDPLIFSPAPQPNSGSGMQKSSRIDPDQRLLRLDFAVPPGLCRLGDNRVHIRVAGGTADPEVKLEKVEVHLDYQ